MSTVTVLNNADVGFFMVAVAKSGKAARCNKSGDSPRGSNLAGRQDLDKGGGGCATGCEETMTMRGRMLDGLVLSRAATVAVHKGGVA